MSTPEGNVGNTGEEYFGLLCYPVPVLVFFGSRGLKPNGAEMYAKNLTA